MVNLPDLEKKRENKKKKKRQKRKRRSKTRMQTHGARDSTENRRKKILPDKALEKFP
jgi:hypothetical protein